MIFQTVEAQTLDGINEQGETGKFTLPQTGKAFSCWVHNAGLAGAHLAFGDPPVAYFIPAGESRYIDKGPAMVFTAHTESGTTKLYLEAGKGV